MRILILPVLLLLTLAGCAETPISANIAKDVLPSGPGTLGGVVVEGLVNATWNLDQAVVVGALKADDPAPKCFHSILKQLGVDPAQTAAPGPSFVPKVSDLISAAASSTSAPSS